METKWMAIADLNLVFGKKEDPMLKWFDEIVYPALLSGFMREGDRSTHYFFWNVELKELRENEYVITGLLIKDTILDVDAQFKEGQGLERMNLHIPSSPYSLFMIYLKNHKVALVRNGKGSPDIRNFAATLRDVLGLYIKKENATRKKENKRLLPFFILHITGIKTQESVRSALEGVKKVKGMRLKLFPLNSEWDSDSLLGAIDEKWRRVLKSKNANINFNSPKSIEGVIKVAEDIEGYADVELEVEYENNSLLESGNTAKIKDGKLSENTKIDISGELDESIDEIDAYCKEKKQMNKVTNNQIIDYQEFLKRRRK